MLRLFIVIVVYTLAIVALPRFGPFIELSEMLARLPTRTAFIINISALISASALLYGLMAKPRGLLYRRPSALLYIARIGLIGAAFASLYDLFQAMSGYAISVQSLLLIPPAFMVGETVYFGVIWGWRRLKRVPGDMFVPQIAQDPQTNHEGGVPRLLITIPVYVFVLVYLPQQQGFRDLEASLVNVGPGLAMIISVLALIAASGFGLWVTKRAPALAPPLTGDAFRDAKAAHFGEVKTNIVVTVCVGLGVAALINIVGYFISYRPSIVLLVIMPLGFSVAEALYQGINWRVKYGPPEV